MIKYLLVILVCLTVSITNSTAEYKTIAFDNASGYTNGWSDGSSGGFGFGTWTITTFAELYAGTYIANTTDNTDLNYIWSIPGYKAWGTFVNGGTVGAYVIAFRGFGSDDIWENKLDETGDTISLSMENNSVDDTEPGNTGFTLRHLNTNSGVGDYNANARFEFGFTGGTANYYIKDNSGTIDTGIGWRNSGFHFRLEITTNINSYAFTIIDAINDNVITNFTGILSGSGSIDSIALFNRNSKQSGTDTYFNNLEIYDYFAPTLFIIK